MNHMRKTALVVAGAVATALAVALPALAHVTVSPAFLAADESTTLAFDAPNEREAEPMNALAVTLPPGLATVSGDQPETVGWQLEVTDTEAVWSGGAVEAGESQLFELKVSASGEPTAVKITAEQRYASGASVQWTPAFTILPASGESPDQYIGRALVAAIVGLVLIGGSLVVARRLRQRTLQED